MDPTAQFFSQLRKLAVTLESQTAELRRSFETRNDGGDSDTTARAMRTYHQVNCDVANLKGQIQDQLAQQRAQENEVSSFIRACRVMEQRVGKDVQQLKAHWEKYGYQAPRGAQRASEDKGQESEAEVAETNSAEEEEGRQEEPGGDDASSPTKMEPPPCADALRTPQLSDFGLSEMQLKRALAGAEWCSEAPPMPEMSLPHPALHTPAPPMPITPKCALRMDDDELQTPQMHDFGISEHTMCLNNDFTMDLLRKNVEKPQRLQQDNPAPPVDSLSETLQRKAENLASPEPPVFCTPGFKIKKTNGHCSPPAQSSGDPDSPGRPGNLPTSPELPAFQTPYVNRLVSAKKSAQQREPDGTRADDDGYDFKLPTPPHNGAADSKRTWEYDVPEVSIMGLQDKQMPEMPNLESCLGNSLQNRSAKVSKKTSERKATTKEEPPASSPELDGPTQEFSLGTPRVRKSYHEPGTPEMPDLSSVTQDICKLVSQAQLKKSEVAAVHPNVRPEKDKPSIASLSVVSEREFQSLPSYLRQMTLYNLNQAVHNINKFTAQFPGERAELQMAELRSITNVGTTTPVYILCLTELKRLEHVRGAGNASVYRLSTRK